MGLRFFGVQGAGSGFGASLRACVDFCIFRLLLTRGILECGPPEPLIRSGAPWSCLGNCRGFRV